MTRREKLGFVLVIVSALVVFLPTVLLWWIVLFAASWYIRKLPEKRLPFAQFVSPSQKTFLEWLSGLVGDLATSPLMLPTLASILGLGGIVILANRSNIHPFISLFAINFVILPFYILSAIFVKYSYWDYYLAQAEPTAQLLVGGKEEYNKLPEAEKKKFLRHVADVLIGINKGTWVVSGGKAKLYNAPAGSLAKFGGRGVLVVQEGHAVVLERSGKISRVVGYGLHFLEPFERVNVVAYLAINSEHLPIKHVITKDKVVIEEIDLYIFHKIDAGDKSRKNGIYPFDVKIIIEKIWTPKGSERDGKSADLSGAVQAVADTAVRDVIAQYDLVDLITAAGDFRQKLKEEFKAAIERVTDFAMGIKIVVVDVGYVKFPEDVEQELIEVVKAKAKKDKAALEAEAKQITTVTHAEAERQAKIKIGEGEREYLRQQGEGKALAAREEGLAKAEGESERVREILLALAQIPIDEKSKMDLLKTIFQGDQYRDAIRMWSVMGRTGRGLARPTGEGDTDTAPPASDTLAG